MFKNTASQKLTVMAFADAGHASLDAGEPVTGDAANITLKIEQDDDGTRSASDDTNPTEVEDGQYRFDLLQAECNGDKLTFYPESSTAGVQVVALPSNVIYTRPPNFPALGIESDGDLTKVNTLNGHAAQTGDSFARLGAPDGASIAADIAVVDGNVDTLLGRITSTLFSGITSLAEWLGLLAGKQTGNATARTELRATGAGSGTYDETADSNEAIRDRGDAQWITATTVDLNADQSGVTIGTVTTNSDMRGTDSALTDKAGFSLASSGMDSVTLPADIITATSIAASALDGKGDWLTSGAGTTHILQDTTIATLASQTSFTLTAGSGDDNAYYNQVAVLIDQSTSTQKSVRKISDYTGSSKTVTLDSAPDFTIAVGDTIRIFAVAPGTTAPTAAQNADAVLDELLADHTTAGSLGAGITSIETQTDKISTTSVQVIDATGGGSSITITQGDTFPDAEGLGSVLRLTKADGENWPTDMSGYTIKLDAEKVSDNVDIDGDADFEWTGSVVTATGASQAIDFADLTGTDGYATGNAVYDFTVTATKDSDTVTLRHGTVNVKERQESA